MKLFKKGFTMIELLVVIAIIGVLAVAVLSAINPLEQINKGKDTRVRSDAAELLNAIDRYFTTQEVFPWNNSTTGGTGGYTPAASSDTPDEAFLMNPAATPDWDWVYALSDVSEVKTQYAQRMATSNLMILSKAGGGAMNPVYVCFKPSSKQFQLEAARKCCTTGCGSDTLAGTAPTIAGVTVCATTNKAISTDNYICLP